MTTNPLRALSVSVLLLPALLAGCSTATSDSSAGAAAPECPIAATDAWVKAAPDGMSAAFGTLTNPSSAPVTLTAADTPAAGAVELHEFSDASGQMSMQPVTGGIAVPANGATVLEPGGLHLMLLDLKQPLVAGDRVTITVTCESGATTTLDAQVRPFAGADEDYAPHSSGGAMPSMAP